MAQQWIEIFEHDARDTVVGDEVMHPLPTMGKLKPKFNPVDESRKEYRGADTGQGDSTVRRKESQWTHSLECYWYPIAAVGVLLKHALGFADTRAVVEITGYRGILLPQNLPFGVGALLGDSAIGIRVNYDDGEGTTVSKVYYGGRITKVSISGEGADDVKLSFELAGPGPFIGAEAAGTTPPDFSALPSPFNAADARCYVGAGITRTGTAPEYTNLAPGTMSAFEPDSWSIEITNGRNDKIVANGVRGPSKTTKESQLSVTANFPVDIRDPSSGFSSHDEIEAQFSGPRELPVLIVLDNGELAGNTSANYGAVIEIPRLRVDPFDEEFNTEGKIPTATIAGSHLYSLTTEYGVAILTTDKETAY